MLRTLTHAAVSAAALAGILGIQVAAVAECFARGHQPIPYGGARLCRRCVRVLQ